VAIILTEKKVDPESPIVDGASDLSLVEAPPEYTPAPLGSASVPLPQASQSTLKPQKERTLFQRWIRSPIAISLVFLGVAVIATGIGLAVHFTAGRGSKNSSSNGGSGSTGDSANATIDYGPWLNLTQTYFFDNNGSSITVSSSDELMDGVTYVQADHDGDLKQVQASVTVQWRQNALDGQPYVDVDQTTQNASMSISCPYVGNVSWSSYIVFANVTITLPGKSYFPWAQISTGALAPHEWSIHVANLTESGVVFGRLGIKAETGDILIGSLDAYELDVASDYGNIGGTVNVSVLNPSDANGVYTLVNLNNSIPSSAAAQTP